MTANAPSESDRPRAEIAFEAKGWVFASYLNIGVAIFAAKPPPEIVRDLRKVTVDLVRDHGRTSTFYITMSGTPLPDAPVRAALQELTNELAKDLIAVASVIYGIGFWASAIRGFATSVHWMSKNNYERRAFGNCHEAAGWLAPLHSAKSLQVDSANLSAQLSQLLDRPSIQP